MNLTTTAFGTWSGGRYMHFGEQLSDERIEGLIQDAWEQGVRTFVTADVYGVGKADEMLGRALKGIDRDSYCLAGMVGHDIHTGTRRGRGGYQRFTDPDLRGPEGYEEYLKMAAEKSLANCGADKFDLIMLHNPDETGYTNAAVWDGMSSLKEAGLADRIGVAPGPANGFVLDLINCFQKFGSQIDWAMLILNPLEPWPQRHVLPVAEKQDISVLTRVVDYGGMFHGDVRPGHHFRDGDHRTYRPAGWVDHADVKLQRMREIAEGHDLSLLQLSCQWNLSQPMVKSVVPTLIQEVGEDAISIDDKLKDLASLPEDLRLTAEEIAEMEKIGDNEGCMALKGASERYAEEEEYVPDAWPVRPDLAALATQHGVNPAW